MRIMEYRSAFIEAISQGNEEKVKNLLSSNIHSINDIVGENSYLYYAVCYKNIKIIKILLNNGAIINPEIFPPFNKENEDIIKLLLTFNIDLNAKDFKGATYLHSAVKNNLKDLVKILIEKGADVNAKTFSQQSVLYLAFQEHNEEIIKDLLQSDIVIDSLNEKKESALHFAVNMKNIELTKIIVEKGADINITNSFGFTPLHLAVRNNNIELVNLLLQYGANTNFKTLKEESILHLAVANNALEIVKVLINKSNVNDRTDQGITPLHKAVYTGNLEMVKLLLDNDADVNAIGFKDETPLNIAVAFEYEKITEYLISNGAVINHGFNDDMLLHIAVFNKNERLVDILLKNNADLTVKYENKQTALHLAVGHKCSKIISMLLKKGANVNDQTENGDTPLHMAVKNGDYNIFKILLAASANINLENNEKKTPLYIAAEKGYLNIVNDLLVSYPDLYKNKFALHFALNGNEVQNKKIVLELLAYGFSIDFIVEYDHIKILDFLKKAVSNGHFGILEYLLKLNAKSCKVLFDLKDDIFKVLIHVAVENNQLEIVKLLIENGVNINAIDEKGLRPMYYAIKYNYSKIIKLLLENKSNIDSDHQLFFMIISSGCYHTIKEFLKYYDNINIEDEFGTTALHFAAWKGDEEIIQLLLERGAKCKTLKNLPQVNFNSQIKSSIQDYYGDDILEDFRKNIVTTPLHIAVRKNYSDIAEAFLESGFDVNVQDGCGRTPLHIACLFYNIEVLDVLMEFNADFYVKDMNGYTCIDYMYKNDHFKHNFLLDKVFMFIHNVENYEDFTHETFDNREIFIKYLVRFNSMNHIDHKNFLITYKQMEKFYKVFEKELEKLKDQIFWKNVSMFDILTKKVDLIALYINNKSFLKIWNSEIQKKITFYKYNKILNSRIRKAKERRFLLDEAKFYFVDVTYLPDLIINNIMSLLTNRDLRCIIEACKT